MAKLLSWKEIATTFQTTWHKVFDSVRYVVAEGFKGLTLNGTEAIGVDAIQFGKGHRYLTLVYQIDANCRRLLYIEKDRKAKTSRGFFREISPKPWHQSNMYPRKSACKTRAENPLPIRQTRNHKGQRVLSNPHRQYWAFKKTLVRGKNRLAAVFIRPKAVSVLPKPKNQ